MSEPGLPRPSAPKAAPTGESTRGVDLHYVGIDEAGFGPMLGPLCVAATAFSLRGWTVEGGAPDLWSMLSPAVCRQARDAKGRIAFNDSKKLKLANSSKRRHPLYHIERGVLSLLPTGTAATEADLMRALGAELGGAAWYDDALAEASLPVACDGHALTIDRNLLATTLAAAGVSVEAVRCETRCEASYNRLCDELGGKGRLNASLVSRLMSEHLQANAEAVRIVCDRQSGRTRYQRVVEEACPGFRVEVVAEVVNASVYRVVDPWRDIQVRFEVGAEARHLPVAAASMTAKYVRELAMGRLNRYWCGRAPELKPTAGYTTDARRWLVELGASATPEERRALVRRS